MKVIDGKTKSSASTGINAVCKPSPFEPVKYHASVSVGSTLADIVGEAPDDVKIVFEGEYIPRSEWSRIKPKDGTTVSIMRSPRGGDGIAGAIGIVAAVVISIYAPVAGAYIAGAVGLGGSAMATGLITAGIFMLSGALINGFFAPEMGDIAGGSIERGEAYNSLYAVTNQPRPYDVVPKIFGAMWTTPPLAAIPYTEVRGGDEQYIYSLMAIGYGNLRAANVMMPYGAAKVAGSKQNGVYSGDVIDLTKIKIGETTLDQFDDWELEIGYADDVDLYIGDVFEDRVNVAFNKADQPLAVIRSTTQATREASIDITFNQGLYSMNKEGDKSGGDWVDFKVEYSLTGLNSWTVVDTYRITSSDKDAFARSFSMVFPTVDQYDIRVTRVGSYNQHGSYVFSDAAWTTLRSIDRESNFSIPDVLLLGMKVRASEQLSGSLDNVSIYVESALPDFDENGLLGTYSITSNPASAYLETMTGVQNTHPVSESRIDFGELVYWRDWCAVNDLEYNWIHTRDETMLQRMMAITPAGFAKYTIDDGRFSVVTDKTQPVSNVITPRNSRNFNATKQFIDLPHAMRVEYLDRNTNQKREVVVFADGYNETNATKYELISTQGIVEPLHAWKFGRYHIAQAILRPEIYTVDMDIESARMTRGDTVKLAYDTMLVGLAWGRIKEVRDQELVVDEVLPFEDGRTYAMMVRKQDGSTTEFTVTAPAGEQRVVNWIQTAGVEEGDLFSFGETARITVDARVAEISASDTDFNATVTMVDAADDIFDAWTAQVPPFDTGITLPPELRDPLSPVVTGLTSTVKNLTRNTDGSRTVNITVSWVLQSSTVPVTSIEVRWRELPNGEQKAVLLPSASSTGQYDIPAVTPGSSYAVEVVAISNVGNQSRNNPVTNITAFDLINFVDTSIPPTISAVESGTDHLLLKQDGTIIERIYIAWFAPTQDREVIQYVVEHKPSLGSNWSSMIVAGDTASAYLTPVESNVGYDIRVRAVYQSDIVSNYATTTHTVVGKLAPPNDVTGLGYFHANGSYVMTWTHISDADRASYNIYRGGAFLLNTKDNFLILTDVSGAVETYEVEGVDTTGNFSTNRASLNIDTGEFPTSDKTANWPDVGGTGRPDDYADVTVDQVENDLAITSGGVVINAGGAFKSNGYNLSTNNGIFFGYSGGKYQLMAGNGTQYMRWDGSDLTIKGHIEADSIAVPTASIGRLELESGSVTETESTYSAGEITTSPAASSSVLVWTDVVTVSITVAENKPVMVAASAALAKQDIPYPRIRLVRDSTVLYGQPDSDASDNTNTVFVGVENIGSFYSASANVIDNPGSGTHAYKLQVATHSTSSGAKARFRSIQATAFLR